MKRTASINFWAIILGIGLLVSLGVNIYQLYSHSTFWPPDGEVEGQATHSSLLLRQLSSCSQENARKDSLIAVLTHRTLLPKYSALSSPTDP